MQLTHDAEADAVYIYLSNNRVAHTSEITSRLTLDYDQQGEVVGLEILDASQGVDLDGLPGYLELRVGRILEEHRFKILTH